MEASLLGRRSAFKEGGSSAGARERSGPGLRASDGRTGGIPRSSSRCGTSTASNSTPTSAGSLASATTSETSWSSQRHSAAPAATGNNVASSRSLLSKAETQRPWNSQNHPAKSARTPGNHSGNGATCSAGSEPGRRQASSIAHPSPSAPSRAFARQVAIDRRSAGQRSSGAASSAPGAAGRRALPRPRGAGCRRLTTFSQGRRARRDHRWPRSSCGCGRHRCARPCDGSPALLYCCAP